MLYRANASEFPFWVYYVEKVIDHGQEIFLFKRNAGMPFGVFLNKDEHYFLYLCNPQRIFDSKNENGIIVVDRYVSEANWKIYLWKTELIGLSSKNKNLELINEPL